jgi:hypothetical protein
VPASASRRVATTVVFKADLFKVTKRQAYTQVPRRANPVASSAII